jgi:hypothetical protein
MWATESAGIQESEAERCSFLLPAKKEQPQESSLTKKNLALRAQPYVYQAAGTIDISSDRTHRTLRPNRCERGGEIKGRIANKKHKLRQQNNIDDHK